MLSIILPVYNEEDILLSSLQNLISYMESYSKRLGQPYEIIIAEDGSNDGTAGIAGSFLSGKATSALPGMVSGRLPEVVRLISSGHRMGRGISLSDSIRAARGDTVLFMDADLSTGLDHIPAFVGAIGSGSDIAVASRLLPGSKVIGRAFLRDLFSRGYNLLLRLLFRTSVHDHQCGFKAFRKDAALPLLGIIEDRHWFWDGELLVLAQSRGLSVVEIPVRWTDRADSHIRLLNDTLYMLLAVMRLRLRLWFSPPAYRSAKL